MTSTLPPLVQAFSGALGGAAANASAYPLDLVCTRLQTSHQRETRGIFTTLQQIIIKRGLLGLYDGLETDTAATLISGFCFFYAYSFLRNQVFKRRPTSQRTATKPPSSASLIVLEEIAIGFLAGIASRAVSTPLSLVTVRLQSEHNERPTDTSNDSIKEMRDKEKHTLRSIATVVKRIYAEGGLRGFWRGFETTTLLCLSPSLTLFFYQAFRKIFLRGRDREQPSPRQAFVGAAISNVIAVTFLYPLILAKTRLQSSSSSENPEKADSKKFNTRNMFTVWRSAYERDGILGLYQGLEAQLLKGFLSQGLAMMVKQRIEQIVVTLYLYYIRQKRYRRAGIR